jgi:hypothetical protein
MERAFTCRLLSCSHAETFAAAWHYFCVHVNMTHIDSKGHLVLLHTEQCDACKIKSSFALASAYLLTMANGIRMSAQCYGQISESQQSILA